MATLLNSATFISRKADGTPNALGRVYTYAAGTLTPLASYTTQAGNVANTNPVVLGADGCAQVWLDLSLAYRIIEKTSADVTIRDTDNITASDLADLASTASGKGSALVGYLPAGAGASTSLTVQDKLRESVSVKDFGAVGNGAADDAAAIQAAINANPGKVIYLPAGAYVITSTLSINTDNTCLKGAGASSTYIVNRTVNGDAIRFASASTVGTGTYLNGVGLSGLYIYRDTPAISGAGIHITQVNGGQFRDFIISDNPQGLLIEGGQFTSFTDFKIFATGIQFDLSAEGESALIRLKDAPITGGLFQKCYTVSMSEFVLAGSRKVLSAILVSDSDGLLMANGYVAGGKYALLNISAFKDGGYVSGIAASNVYFDGVNNATGSEYCVYIPADAWTTFAIYDVAFSACIFGNTKSGGILGRRGVATLRFTGNTFVNINTWAIDVEGDSGSSSLNIVGNQFNGVGLLASGTGAVRSRNLYNFVYSSNAVRIDSGLGATVLLSQTIRQIAITGNTHRANTADLSYSAVTGATHIAISGNSGQDTNPVSSFSGNRIGNVQVNDPRTLDWYEEGTFTPSVAFGGLAVGLSYATQSGQFTRIGDRVMFNMLVTLSNKGSSAGDMAIFGLPYANGAGFAVAVSSRTDAITSGVGDTDLAALIPTGQQSIQIFKILAGTSTSITNADVTNTSSFHVAGTYRV